MTLTHRGASGPPAGGEGEPEAVPADHLSGGLLPQAHGGAPRPQARERPAGRPDERQDRRLRYTSLSLTRFPATP